MPKHPKAPWEKRPVDDKLAHMKAQLAQQHRIEFDKHPGLVANLRKIVERPGDLPAHDALAQKLIQEHQTTLGLRAAAKPAHGAASSAQTAALTAADTALINKITRLELSHLNNTWQALLANQKFSDSHWAYNGLSGAFKSKAPFMAQNKRKIAEFFVRLLKEDQHILDRTEVHYHTMERH